MSARALPTLIALILAGLWGAALGFGHLRGETWFLERVEATMADLRTLVRGSMKPPDVVTIVAIDDEVVLEQGSYPLPRATLARIIDEIARFEPEVIAVDILLVDRGPEAGDQALARSLGRTAGVIAAAAVFEDASQWVGSDGGGSLARVPSAERFILPLKTFSDVAAVGVVNVASDQAGSARSFPMLFRAGERIEASFPLRVAAVATGVDPEIEPNRLSLDGRLIRTDAGYLLPLAFYGPRGTIRTIGAAAVLGGQLVRENIQGRIVVIGATATGSGDVFSTPFDSVLPGVEVVATAISHLMAGDGMVRDQRVRLADAGLATALPMVLVGLLGWRRNAIGFAAIVALVLGWLVVNVVAFWQGIWLSAALPMAAAVPPAILFGASQLWLGRRRAQHFAKQTELLQRFQAPGLGEWLAAHPDFLAEPVREDAAIVFIDLSGFTALSQRLGPNAVRELLDAFYKLVEEEVVAHGGAITNFMGDGAMILFGLPEPTPRDAFNAAGCCVGLSNRTRAWLQSLPAATASRIGFKLGAHFGPIIASRLGGGSHQQITATGDTVNVANRLMEVAAGHGVELALSDELLQVAGPDCALLKSGVLSGPMETQIRGRSGSLAIRLWHSAP